MFEQILEKVKEAKSIVIFGTKTQMEIAMVLKWV